MKEKKYCEKTEQMDVVYGVHAVKEALQANTGNKLYIQNDLRGKNVESVKALAAEKKVSISWTPKKTLTEITDGAVHQGFVLRVSEFAYADLSVIFTVWPSKTIDASLPDSMNLPPAAAVIG